MKGVSFKNFSLLGLVLMAASAVTAAVLPSKSDSNRAPNGQRLAGTADGGAILATCEALTGAVACTATADSTTTAGGRANSTQTIGGLNYNTVNNTSGLDVNGVDVSSVEAQA